MDSSPSVAGLAGANGGSTIGSPASARLAGRKRGPSIAGLDSSPGSIDDGDGDEGQDDRRRQPGVKRACNECRQQKLRCDVVQDPFTTCSRCRRLKLDCKIESNFKRIGKRSKNAEMEREIIELRRQLANQSRQNMEHQVSRTPMSNADSPGIFNTPSREDQYMGSHEAVASLLDLRQGLDGSQYTNANGRGVGLKKIENVVLTPDRVKDLFNHFFTFYHQFLPFLDPEKPPDQYYKASPLLFWAIISVAARRYNLEPTLLSSLSGPVSRLIWSTLAEVPQSYYIVKALCLLCTWPFPISSTSTDPTFMLTGTMMQIAMQIGLHRPSHAQDFTKIRVELREEELRDRVKTWAACNIVAQSVATGFGQPPSAQYDWTVEPVGSHEGSGSYQLPDELAARLQIEKFCDKVTKALYSNHGNSTGLYSDHERSIMSTFLIRDFEELEERIGDILSPIKTLHIRAAGLHLRLFAFFDSNAHKSYRQDLLGLYFATTSFLETALNLETALAGAILPYTSNYILQLMIAAGFTLLKLLNSFFAPSIDLEYGKSLFNRTIWAIRSISVASNDLPSRLAEVLAQLWRAGGGGSARPQTTASNGMGGSVVPDTDSSLQLKVRCRMSMSLVFDSVWRWREEFQAKGRGNLDSAVRNPTNPDSGAENQSQGQTTSSTPNHMNNNNNMHDPSSSSSASTAHATGLLDPSLSAPMGVPGGGGGGPGGAGGGGPGGDSLFAEPTNYEVFDPLNWMLDGLVDFPYSLDAVQGLEASGLA
ncbi:MAG: hypothetical protein M1819_007089 [Sarea resinae]|nr:MAG: hypothetical protein M1819_007089 [Sarea resinae]